MAHTRRNPLRPHASPAPKPLSAGPACYVLICWECRRVGTFKRERLVTEFGDVPQSGFGSTLALANGCPGKGYSGTVSMVTLCYARFLHGIAAGRRYREEQESRDRR